MEEGPDSNLVGERCQVVSVCPICLMEAGIEMPGKEALCASGGHLHQHLLLLFHKRRDGDTTRAGSGTCLLLCGADLHRRCHRLPGVRRNMCSHSPI